MENLLVRHKLALVYAHFGQCDQARQALAEARAFLSPELPAIYDALRALPMRLHRLLEGRIARRRPQTPGPARRPSPV